MLNLERILTQDRLMRAMTGINLKAFEELLISFTKAYEESILKSAKKRKRAHGGGRKSVLSTVSAKLLFILVYCKCYPTFEQKEENKEFSSQRVKCEHAHAGINRYNCVVSIYRNRVTDFDDQLMLVVTGLWNFYLIVE
jgi:hypothetical protein